MISRITTLEGAVKRPAFAGPIDSADKKIIGDLS